MIVTVNSQALASELRLINKVVPNKPVIPILSHLLLTAEGDKLRLYATDLEVALTSSCPATIDLPGTAALPAAKLLAMTEQFPDADVVISLEKEQRNQQVLVRCGAFKSRLQAQPVGDFPVPPAVEGLSCMIDAGTLSWLLGKARHATSANASRHVLNGALFKLTGDKAGAIATDGKRLVVATASRSGPDVDFIVPSKAMDLLMNQLAAGDVEVTKGPRHLFFAMDGRMLTSRTVDGAFPAYERIVPRDNDKTVTFDRNLLTSALRRVILAAEDNGAVIFQLKPSVNGDGATMELASASAGVGSADEFLEVEYAGPPLKVCMNGEYMLDFLGVAQEPTMTMRLKNANSAALIQDGNACFAVIMLMRA